MLINPVVANLHNLKTDRFHPILFREAPQPSYSPGDKLVRSKSVGHHTIGFDHRNEAISECERIAESQIGSRLCVRKDFVWDGEETPAMVVFFGQQDGETIPVL
ncbi:MAG: hypothetical protein WC055_01045 [Melioribacteraceae bacterium]